MVIPMKKRLLTLFLVFITALSLCSGVMAASLPEEGTGNGFYVNDACGVLSENTVESVCALNGNLEEECHGAQFVVVTVPYIEGDSEVIAAQLMNDWKVGGFGTGASNGMLLLFSPIEKRGWLAVGADIAPFFDADTFLEEYFWPDCDAARYDSAVMKLADNVASFFIGYYGIGEDAISGSDGSRGIAGERHSSGGNIYVLLFIILLVILVAAVISDRRKYYRYHRYIGGPIPAYHFWFMWMRGPRYPYHSWRGPVSPGMPWLRRYTTHNPIPGPKPQSHNNSGIHFGGSSFGSGNHFGGSSFGGGNHFGSGHGFGGGHGGGGHFGGGGGRH